MVCGLREGAPEEMAFPLDLKDEETRPRERGQDVQKPWREELLLARGPEDACVARESKTAGLLR